MKVSIRILFRTIPRLRLGCPNGAKALGNLSVAGRLTYLDNSRIVALLVGASRVVGLFFL